MAERFYKLTRQNDIDPVQPQAFCGVAPEQLLGLINYIVEHFFVDLGEQQKTKQFIFQNDIPGPSDRNKVWVRTQEPYSVNYWIDGHYISEYLYGWPVNIPFLSAPSIIEKNVAGLSMLSGEQLQKYGITDTPEDATERMRWFLFAPEPITV